MDIYLLIFCGVQQFHERRYFKYLIQELNKSNSLGVQKVQTVKDELVDLLFQSLLQDSDGNIPRSFSWDVLKLSVDSSHDLKPNEELDSFLLDTVHHVFSPVGCQFFYHIKEDKIHTISRFVDGEPVDNDLLMDLEPILDHAGLLYHSLYFNNVNEEHQSQIAKLYLSLKTGQKLNTT